MTRVAEELELLRTAYPALDYKLEGGQHWILLPQQPIPPRWSAEEAEIAFMIPAQAGQQPYAFFTRPAITLAGGGTPSNYTTPASTPWGADFAQFSWAPLETWVPKPDIRAGANMLNFARSFADRLGEAS
jgi:hypothetical protein